MPRRVVVQVGEHESGGEKQVGLEPRFARSVNVEQIIRRIFAVRDFAFAGSQSFAGKTRHLPRVIEVAEFVHRTETKVG